MSEPVRFLLNGERVDVAGLPPQTTLLEFLRDERRLTGTKEGCAEGDCGACTVVHRGARRRASRVEARQRVHPAACRRSPARRCSPSKACKSPRRRRCIRCSRRSSTATASQCGFCTPGFAMSLFGLYKNAPARHRAAAIDDALSGNLCRCTGYRPIVAAAQRDVRRLPSRRRLARPGVAATAAARSAGRRALAAQLATLGARRAARLRSCTASAGRRRARATQLAAILRRASGRAHRRRRHRRRHCGSPSSTAMLGDIIYVGDVADLARHPRDGDASRDRRRGRR